MGKMLNLLREGDNRTTGQVAEAVRVAIVDPRHIGELVGLMY